MRIKINKDSDTLYFRLDENSIVESEEVRPGVVLDFDKDDKVVGVEFLGVSERATDAEPCSFKRHKNLPNQSSEPILNTPAPKSERNPKRLLSNVGQIYP